MILTSLLQRFTLKWYEWLFIGVLTLMMIFTYLFYQRMQELDRQAAVSDYRLVLSYEELQRQKHIRDIDDLVVTRTITRLNESMRQQNAEHDAFIADYLRLVRSDPPILTEYPEVVKDEEVPVEPPMADVPVTPPRVEEATPHVTTPPKAPRPARTPAADLQPDRVMHISQRMWAVYCQAPNRSSGCPTTTTDERLPGK